VAERNVDHDCEIREGGGGQFNLYNEGSRLQAATSIVRPATVESLLDQRDCYRM
jgi:hypothetical protein